MKIFCFFPLSVLDCPALTLQSSRSLDTLSDLKLQQLEAELEGARHEAQGACQREEELKGECERLKEEMRMLQNQSQRDRVSVCLFQATHYLLTTMLMKEEVSYANRLELVHLSKEVSVCDQSKITTSQMH